MSTRIVLPVTGQRGIQIAFTIPIFWIVWYCYNYPNEVYSYFYFAIEWLKNYKISAILLGSNLILLFGLLSKMWPSASRNKPQKSLLTSLIIIGIIIPAIALLSDIFKPQRFGNPSVQLIQNNGLIASTDVKRILSNIGEDYGVSIPLSDITNAKTADAIKQSLINTKKGNHDIVIIDSYNPFNYINELDFSKFINPRTLYIITQPCQLSKFPKFKNVLSISPQFIDETLALALRQNKSKADIEIYRSDDKIGELSETIFRRLLGENHRIKVSSTTDNFHLTHLKKDNAIIWLDWNQTPSMKIDLDKLKEKAIVFTGSHEKSKHKKICVPSLIPLVDNTQNIKDDYLKKNQLALINSIIDTHFGLERPLDISKTFNLAIEKIKLDNLGNFDFDKKFIHRYGKLAIQ